MTDAGTPKDREAGFFSMEVVPPARGAGLGELFAAVETLLPYGPTKVSVTDHPAGSAYAAPSPASDRPVRVSLRSKPGTLGTALAIKSAFNVKTVPHIVATRADRFDMEDMLIDLDYAGFRELFVVRGDEQDSPFALGSPVPAGQGYSHAVDLVAHVAALNRGEYLPPVGIGRKTSFVVGVAGYPEKHYASPNLDADIRRLKEKVDAGASYIITQMLFDARRYFDFVDRIRAVGIDVPVIPGIKPLTRASQASSVPRNFYVDLPDALVRALEEARTPAEERTAGIAAAAKLSEALLAGGAPSLHFFTMGKGGATKAVLDAVFGGPEGAHRSCRSEGESR
jgi:methylenetetrahydrofolate reductase (NADPH)